MKNWTSRRAVKGITIAYWKNLIYVGLNICHGVLHLPLLMHTLNSNWGISTAILITEWLMHGIAYTSTLSQSLPKYFSLIILVEFTMDLVSRWVLAYFSIKFSSCWSPDNTFALILWFEIPWNCDNKTDVSFAAI